MTEVTVSKENIEKARRELETALDLAKEARTEIEQALRIAERQGERIEALRRSLGLGSRRVN